MDQRILQIIQKHPELKSEFEEIYPELKDNENEKIRKALIHLISEQDGILTAINGISVKDILAYLEKQKEQKSLNISAASEWLRKYVCNYVNSEYNEFHKCVEYDGSIDKERLINDFEEAMQEEQKPLSTEETELNSIAFLERMGYSCISPKKEQKSTPAWMPKFLDELRSKKNYFDWDEHRDIEGGILAIINWIAPNYFKQKETKSNIEKLKEISTPADENWFEIQEQWEKEDEQKPAEWSEENLERAIKDWLYDNDCRGWDKYGNIYVSLRDLVKLVNHFATQPHWKPSEEQMQGLRRGIVKAYEGSDAKNAMVSLYNDLKKL